MNFYSSLKLPKIRKVFSLYSVLIISFGKFIFFSLLFGSLTVLAESPSELNRKGLAQLNKGDLEKAETFFRQVLLLEPYDHIANYNLACTLAIKLKQNFCEYEDLLYDIYGYLSNAVKEKPEYKTKALVDSDLEILRPKIGFYESLNYDFKKKQDIATVIAKVQWYGPELGIFGPGNGLDFQLSGKLMYWYLDPNRLIYDEVKKKYISGKYYWKGSRLVIRFASRLPKGRRDYYGEFKDRKVFLYGLGEFTDESGICSH